MASKPAIAGCLHRGLSANSSYALAHSVNAMLKDDTIQSMHQSENSTSITASELQQYRKTVLTYMLKLTARTQTVGAGLICRVDEDPSIQRQEAFDAQTTGID